MIAFPPPNVKQVWQLSLPLVWRAVSQQPMQCYQEEYFRYFHLLTQYGKSSNHSYRIASLLAQTVTELEER
jgi:hypothetical protein